MVDRFNVIASPLDGLVTLARKTICDERGNLERIFCEADLGELLLGRHIAQVNRTTTKRTGTVRGMHFQRPPSAETKIVSCLRGSVFDVAVDLRAGSRTFLQWYGEVLSEDNHRALYIPEGFAHGFQTLSNNVEMLYLHTAAHDSKLEGGVNALDPRIGIRWLLDFTAISLRDQNILFLEDDYKGIAL